MEFCGHCESPCQLRSGLYPRGLGVCKGKSGWNAWWGGGVGWIALARALVVDANGLGKDEMGSVRLSQEGTYVVLRPRGNVCHVWTGWMINFNININRTVRNSPHHVNEGYHHAYGGYIVHILFNPGRNNTFLFGYDNFIRWIWVNFFRQNWCENTFLLMGSLAWTRLNECLYHSMMITGLDLKVTTNVIHFHQSLYSCDNISYQLLRIVI